MQECYTQHSFINIQCFVYTLCLHTVFCIYTLCLYYFFVYLSSCVYLHQDQRETVFRSSICPVLDMPCRIDNKVDLDFD